MARLIRMLIPLLAASACTSRPNRWYELLQPGERPGEGSIIEAFGEIDELPGDVLIDTGSGGDKTRITVERVIPLTEAEAKERMRMPHSHLLTRSNQRPDASQVPTDSPPDMSRVR